MDCKKLTILKFLELIEKNGSQTQRRIAKGLDISLGNANMMVKGLVESGYIQVQVDSKNKLWYRMTPKGDSEKVRLTYEYLNYSMDFCCDIQTRIKKTFNELCRQNIRSVVFYGAGELAKLAFQILQQTPLELLAVVDADLAGNVIFGMLVMEPEELASLRFDKIYITELVDGRTIENISEELTISRDELITVMG